MYRNLTEQEIKTLLNNNCNCSDWDKIKVADNFKPDRVKNSDFSGDISLGVFETEYFFEGGVKKQSGVYNAVLHNCKVGNNVYINNVRDYIANYEIGDDSIINNVDILCVEEFSYFGNNLKVSVLSETGGREVPIFNFLSAQMAYIMAMYRHRSRAVERLKNLIENYSLSVGSAVGSIGKGTRINSCKSIKNVNIGEYAEITGCYRLYNGTINSCEADHTHVGFGVTAENFIISTGAKLSDGAVIFSCFVGQGCELSKQYSAENSLFFANSAGFHGEASSIFAGPFTVTHHKSTLLIAGMFSFMNAGSGSNQSNHMYKLGPIHQGIMERGAKTASDSYILWPSKIGAFTSVMGRHYKHADTSDMPFSYLIENNDQSVLVPGAGLRSVGTIRDAKKWPKRDKRKDPMKLDFVNYNLLSPFTIQRVMNGKEILEKLCDFSGKTTETYTYKNALIRNSSLRHGIALYHTAIIKFLGNSIISRLKNYDCHTDEDIRARLKPSTDAGAGDWVDVGGMIAPKSTISAISDDIENGNISTVKQLYDRLKYIHESYYEFEWTWAYNKLHYITDKNPDELCASDITEIVKKWCDAVVDLDKMLYNDAHKEFTLDYRVSFGTDGTEEERNADFEQVRGDFEKNPFVVEVIEHIRIKTELAEFMYNKMKGVMPN